MATIIDHINIQHILHSQQQYATGLAEHWQHKQQQVQSFSSGSSSSFFLSFSYSPNFNSAA